MSLCKGEDGNWFFNCFGCGARGDTVKYLQLTKGMTFVDAVKELNQAAATAPIKQKVAEYDYTDETGRRLYQVVRYSPKDFRVRRPTERGWDWCLTGLERVLYRLHVLSKLKPGQTIYYVEGEKDVESLEKHGLVATTHAGGAGSFRAELLDRLPNGCRIVVVPDRDEPGMALMRKVFAAGRDRGHDVGFLLLPEHKDITEWFEAGKTWEEAAKHVK
jgi:DNA primase